ncbi:MAG: DUF4410 domain-containing protein [Deltaproteobacteria bacterium]|nr:DUF4410 domain-containing protein [Deltaproteobacteria bacterium]
MRRLRRRWRTLLLAAAASGCAAAELDVTRPVPIPLHAVTLTLHDRSRGEMSPEDQEALREIFVEQLEAARIRVLPASAPGAANVEGAVLEFDGGMRPLRFLTGYGLGTGSFVTAWRVRTATSDDIARCRIEGSVSTGTFGGSYHAVLEDAGRALARFLHGEIR